MEVKKQCSSFSWKGLAGSAVGDKVSWEIVCGRTNEGGLGIKRLEHWKKACLSRLIWMLYYGIETWITWRKNKFTKWKVFLGC